jgi:hypothetical protein
MASGVALTPAIIATWPTPNYVDPVSQRASIDAAVYATTITMLCFVTARIYVRANQKSGVGSDDWFIVAAAVRSFPRSFNLYLIGVDLWYSNFCMLIDLDDRRSRAPSLRRKAGIACELCKGTKLRLHAASDGLTNSS